MFVPSDEQALGEFVRSRLNAAELVAAKEVIAGLFRTRRDVILGARRSATHYEIVERDTTGRRLPFPDIRGTLSRNDTGGTPVGMMMAFTRLWGWDNISDEHAVKGRLPGRHA